MKKTLTCIFILIVIFFILFLPKNEEREVNLGNGYYYIPFQEVIFDVTGFGGNGIYMYKNNLKVPIIFSEIEEYKYDSTYIIIKQKFDLKTRYLLENMIFMPGVYFEYDEGLVLLDKKYQSGINTFNNSIERKKYIDKVMQEDKYLKKMIENIDNYYIIDKADRSVIGPLKQSEFDNLKAKLYISMDL